MSKYFMHLAFEGLGAAGGYYARSFCRHAWHRIALTVVWTALATGILVTQIG
jgi:hypothetical protein